MSCERPILLRNPKGGTFKAICGTCRSCLIEDVTDWAIRLKNENKHCFSAYFLTLTYSDENNDGILHKEHLQQFFQNLRNKYRKVDKTKPIKYLAVGEYGEQTERPHYHAIVFNVPEIHPVRIKQIIADAWGRGQIVVGSVTDQSINYTCKYIFKQKNWKGDKPKPFRIMSTRPAIGSDYIKTNLAYHYEGERFYFSENGVKKHLPRFYRKKMFDDEMAERYRESVSDWSTKQHEEIMNSSAEENVQGTIKKIKRLEMTDVIFRSKINQTERI
nr:MAG: replication initiator protein [Microvirus sp.]